MKVKSCGDGSVNKKNYRMSVRTRIQIPRASVKAREVRQAPLTPAPGRLTRRDRIVELWVHQDTLPQQEKGKQQRKTGDIGFRPAHRCRHLHCTQNRYIEKYTKLKNEKS